jgi:hypothetical protein
VLAQAPVDHGCDQVVGDQLAGGHAATNLGAQLGVVLDVPAEDVADADVFQVDRASYLTSTPLISCVGWARKSAITRSTCSAGAGAAFGCDVEVGHGCDPARAAAAVQCRCWPEQAVAWAVREPRAALAAGLAAAGLSRWTLGRLTVRGRPSRMVVRRMEYAELLQQVQTAAALDRAAAERVT